VQALINRLDLFMQLTAGYVAAHPVARALVAAEVAAPGATRLQSALAGWISRYTARPAPEDAESVTTALITKLLTNPLA
jgi:hypothetical protein